MGEPLPLSQDQVVRNGYAIEARIAAERADRGFIPAVGRMVVFDAPFDVRFDSGVASGSEIGADYDSLLAKAISHAPTREGAAVKLASALRDLVALGPPTTAPFLADVLETPAFLAGVATTALISEAFPDGWTPKAERAELARAVAAAIGAAEARPPLRFAASPWSTLAAFRLLAPAGGHAVIPLFVSDNSGEREIHLKPLGATQHEAATSESALLFALEFNGDAFVVSDGAVRLPGRAFASDGRVHVWLAGETYWFRVSLAVDRAPDAAQSRGRHGAVTIETPGVVAEVRVAAGDIVEEGQTIAVIESMKLFMPIVASVGGRVEEVHISAGEPATAGALLAVIAVQRPDT